jgi:NhaA family Na+:H+ antiporter
MTEPGPAVPSEVSLRAHRLARTVLGPIERVLHVEAASGVLLLIMTAVALGWANSSWGASYEHLWHVPVTFGIGGWSVSQSLHFLINEGLMTLFFLVVGLEIRREMAGGELSDVRRASVPLAAALGGMLVPAVLFLALLPPDAVRRGWGVPMATDIAFAVGVLALLGPRVAPALRVLLLALAIVDDVGAIVVIAIFYSAELDVIGFIVAAAGLLLALALQRAGARRALLYVPAGAIVWWGLLRGGVHPTLSGVALGLMTPAHAWYGAPGLASTAQHVVEETGQQTKESDLMGLLAELGHARREAVAPTIRLQALLHPWVAFAIMPLFALANAGVKVDLAAFAAPASRAAIVGVAVGLLVGKPVGVVLGTFIAVKAGLSTLPRGVRWSGILLVGVVAGIGFTMAIFIAGLAFPDPELLASAKLGVLIASGVAAIVGLLYGWLTLPRAATDGARSASEAESSTEH